MLEFTVFGVHTAGWLDVWPFGWLAWLAVRLANGSKNVGIVGIVGNKSVWWMPIVGTVENVGIYNASGAHGWLAGWLEGWLGWLA